MAKKDGGKGKTSTTFAKIKKAAELKVSGSLWGDIAAALGYKSGDSARMTLCHAHPDEWRDNYERARELFLDGIEVDAVSVQTGLMHHSRSDHVRQMAAHSILAHVSKLRGQRIELTGKDGKDLLAANENWVKERDLIIAALNQYPEAKADMIDKLNGRLTTKARLT